MDMNYFWAKHNKKVIIGGVLLLLSLIGLIYFIFFYTHPVEPETLPDSLTTIDVELSETAPEDVDSTEGEIRLFFNEDGSVVTEDGELVTEGEPLYVYEDEILMKYDCYTTETSVYVITGMSADTEVAENNYLLAMSKSEFDNFLQENSLSYVTELPPSVFDNARCSVVLASELGLYEEEEGYTYLFLLQTDEKAPLIEDVEYSDLYYDTQEIYSFENTNYLSLSESEYETDDSYTKILEVSTIEKIDTSKLFISCKQYDGVFFKNNFYANTDVSGIHDIEEIVTSLKE